jgi:hypothetical protein
MEKENITRNFIVSSELFSDYNIDICLYDISTIDDIIDIMKKKLLEDLKKLNLNLLCDIVDRTNFHIHNFNIEDILTSKPDSRFFICDHC